jgi:CheY-like chemotaxis protein
LRADVSIAGSGSAAIESVRSGRYDLAFVDIHLPDANGLDLMLQIRDLSPATKIVVLSSDGSSANRECAFARGAWQFIEKPFDLCEIAQVLGDCNSGPVQERRSGKRMLCRLPLRFDLIEREPERTDSLPCSFEAMATDVSDHGLRILTAFDLRPGQVLRLHPSQSDDPCAAKLHPGSRAQVVWVAPSHDVTTAGLAYTAD